MEPTTELLVTAARGPVDKRMSNFLYGTPTTVDSALQAIGKVQLGHNYKPFALEGFIWPSLRMERTGTPMFIAREVSSETPIFAPRGLQFKKLRERLQVVERHRNIFNRAFPDSAAHADFMRRFLVVQDREYARYIDEDDETYYNANELHRAHHDAESFYWVFQWCFARALPKGRNVDTFERWANPTEALATYCNIMLDHTVGHENLRDIFLNTTPQGCESIFHKDLQRFAAMFSAMATYLSIPWHVYLADNTVNHDHAHHALRRILLLEIISLRDEGKDFNHELDPSQPRIHAALSVIYCADWHSEIHLVKSSYVLAGSSSSHSKRKADQRDSDASIDGAPATKKVKTQRSQCEPAARSSLSQDEPRLEFGTAQ